MTLTPDVERALRAYGRMLGLTPKEIAKAAATALRQWRARWGDVAAPPGRE